MREKLIPIIFLAAVVFLQTFATLPVSVGALVLLAVLFRQNWIFIAAFLTGLIFDILTLRTLGLTSVFLVFLVFLIFLYQNKFEIQTVPFVFISTFLASFIFLIILGYQGQFFQALLVSLGTSLVFRLISGANR